MMQSNANTSKLKNLYESLDQLKESGEDVVAEIRKEINNIELQYLKENVFPELMKFLSRKISWLRCSVDMSLQFDGEKLLDYSFCKSGSTVFIRDKYECDNLATEVIFDIEERDENEPQTNLIGKSRINDVTVTGRAKYSLNGGEPQNKRSIVRSVVSLYMKLHPRSTWSEVLEVFPQELQGSYGVVVSIENIQYRIKKGFDDEKRYFLDPASQFTTIDGVVFAVCHQWGNQFDKFREYVEDKLGWMIEEV